MHTYIFRRYSADYTRIFGLQKRKLIRILGKSAKIEHVGSTSVPGLGGKKIVDILVGTKKGDGTEKRKLGVEYEFVPTSGTKNRLFFKGKNVNGIGVHIHLVKLNGKDWKEMIKFRDYLRNNPESRKDYSEIKKEAVKFAKGNGKLYQEKKKKLIKKIMKEVG